MASNVIAEPVTADELIHTGTCTVYGWSIGESAGAAAAATVVLRDGTDATGPIKAVIELAGDASSTQWFGPQGIRFLDGLFVDVTAGTVTGAVFWG